MNNLFSFTYAFSSSSFSYCFVIGASVTRITAALGLNFCIIVVGGLGIITFSHRFSVCRSKVAHYLQTYTGFSQDSMTSGAAKTDLFTAGSVALHHERRIVPFLHKIFCRLMKGAECRFCGGASAVVTIYYLFSSSAIHWRRRSYLKQSLICLKTSSMYNCTYSLLSGILSAIANPL